MFHRLVILALCLTSLTSTATLALDLSEPAPPHDCMIRQQQGCGLSRQPKDRCHTPAAVNLAPNIRSLENSPIDAELLTFHSNVGLGTLLGAIVNRLIYFTAAKVSKVIVKTVLEKLLKHKKIHEKDPVTVGYVQQALEKITVIILTKSVDKAKKPAKKLINLGADNQGKVKRQTIEGTHPLSLVTWDLSDDGAHLEGNRFRERRIIDEQLRDYMVGQGLRNITFAHHSTSDSTTPFLVYERDNGSLNYHWRPAESRSIARRDIDDRHYPFFDADGAGFKISAEIAIGSKAGVIPAKDAAAIAQLMVKDFISNRGGASYVGYQEQSKTDKTIGHRLCFIAEDTKFGLDSELDKCFGK